MESEQKALSGADIIHQIEVKDQEGKIALLKKEKQIAASTLWIVIGTTLLVCAILVLLYHNFRRHKGHLATTLLLIKTIEQERAAREAGARQNQKDLTEAVIKAQERAIIGLELHDNINQVLTTIKLYTGMAQEGMGDQKALLSRASGLLQQCIDEIRLLSRRLSAPCLGKISLEEFLNDLLDTIAGTSTITITRDIHIPAAGHLDKDLHIGLYRIVQEGLSNVVNHAHATEVLVKLEQESSLLHLSISDNGKECNLRAPRAGVGLKKMKSRAENLNGSFWVESTPAAGCTITVSVPLSPKE